MTKEELQLYDSAMNQANSILADEQYYENLEAEVHQSMYEEYMWYKHEDYMLRRQNNDWSNI